MNALGRGWLLLVATFASVLVWYFVARGQLGRDAMNAMNVSDRAFDAGQLHESVERASYAAAGGSIDARVTSRAIERLRAIAVGAEATGRRASALLAWSGLAIAARDREVLRGNHAKLQQDALEHLDQLLSSATRTHRQLPNSDPPGLGISSAQVQHTPYATTLLVTVLSGVAALMGPSSRLVRARTGQMRHLTASVLLLAATSSWCLGWLLT